MVFTADIVIGQPGAHGSLFDPQARRPTMSPAARSNSIDNQQRKPFWKSLSTRSSSSDITRDQTASLSRTNSSVSSDAVATVLITDIKPDNKDAVDDKVGASSSKGPTSGAAAGTKANSKGKQCTAAGSSKLKRKLKAAAMFVAEGLSWSAHSRAALPVPICPSLVV